MMKRNILLFATFFCCLTAMAQSVSITKFLGNKPAAVSLTYDDGLLEHYTLVAPELEKRGFRGTFWMQYKRERESTILDTTPWQDVNGLLTMTVRPHCALDTVRFNMPLTLCVNTSDGAAGKASFNVKATQDGKELGGYIDGHNGATLFDINPFGGPVTITETKVINVIGDSYVQNHKRPWTETWHYKMAKELGYVYNNYGKNGSCVAFDRTHDGKYNFGPAMTTKTKLLDPRADYVIIIAGHNDACKVGNNKDSLNMFRLALDTLLCGIKRQCPNARIGYVTPWYNDVAGFKQVVSVIKKVCKAHRVPVLDNYTKNSVIKVRDAEFRKKYFQSPKDNAHLNASGHDVMLPVAKAWFGQYVQ